MRRVALAGACALATSGCVSMHQVSPTEVRVDQQSTQRTSHFIPGHTHRVRTNETVWGISARYGVDPDEVRRLNGLNEEYGIRAGEDLKIPPR